MGVRRAVVGDEVGLRSIRLQALAEAPEAFAASLAENEARPIEAWRSWLSPGATFLFDGDDGEPLGLVAVVADDDDPEVRHLMSMWVAPTARRAGVGDALVRAAIEWARAEGARRARVEAYASNVGAIRLYERSGFRRTGHARAPDAQGRVGIELDLDLAP